MSTESTADAYELPPLSRDRAFWAMTITQFLGAFNDNLFKQLLLLMCVDFAARSQSSGDKFQTMAQALFAIPFVLFSGFAGYLSDRGSKRTIIVLCKVLEIVVMGAGMVVLLAGDVESLNSLYTLLGVLFFMGMQSALFGPSKYGILPEMLHDRDLPEANGIIQMTTFLAIIFGTAAAGYGKEFLGQQLWWINLVCVVIAIIGTVTSLPIRKTPVAHPGLKFTTSAVGINSETWQLLKSDRIIRGVMLLVVLFWFAGGIVLPTVNAFGKLQLNLGDQRTSILASCMGVGIALGCVVAGKLSHERIRFEFVKRGAWGLAIGFGALAALGISTFSITVVEWLARLALIGVGVSAGVMVVPLQVCLQTRPPQDQKGRMIGTMNLLTWIGILTSAGFYFACTVLLDQWSLPMSWTFAAVGAMFLPVAIFHQPPDQPLP